MAASFWLLVLVGSAAVLAATGKPAVEERSDPQIVGGETASISAVPYQVSIERSKIHFCGGSIISTTWILTAAHCVYGSSASVLQIRVGTHTLQNGGAVYPVSLTVVHPKYVHLVSSDWDVALVRLSKPIVLSSVAKVVTLPSSGREPTTNSPVTVSGWGYTTAQSGDINKTTGTVSSQLRKAVVRVIARQTCASVYRTSFTNRMLCAAAPGKDSCTYDSGGPLVDSSNVQVGVVSWGKGCADSRYPGIYVHLGNADVRSFIKMHTKL